MDGDLNASVIHLNPVTNSFTVNYVSKLEREPPIVITTDIKSPKFFNAAIPASPDTIPINTSTTPETIPINVAKSILLTHFFSKYYFRDYNI